MAEQNWSKNVTYATQTILTPGSVEELAELIRTTPKLRILGTRHTFNHLTDTDAVLVSLEALASDEVEVVGQTADGQKVVRVSGAVRYGDLAVRLEEQGLALANMASLPHISVAGAIQTGTHGSGDEVSGLGTQVVALEFVNGTGQLVRLTEDDEDFAGAVVGLGALGALTHVELRTEPTYEMTQTVYDHVRWDDVLARLDEFTALADSVSLLTQWNESDGCIQQVWLKHRSSDAPDLSAFGGVPVTEKRHTVRGDDPGPCTDQGTPGPWFERLPHFKLEFTPSSGEEIQVEYLVPRADAVEALRSVRALADRIEPLIFVTEIRTIQADDLWLSMAHGTDVVGIHFTFHPDESAVRELLPAIEQALPDSARPHWGKVYELDPAEVTRRYPKWDDFVALARKHDPERRFVNAYLEPYGL